MDSTGAHLHTPTPAIFAFIRKTNKAGHVLIQSNPFIPGSWHSYILASTIHLQSHGRTGALEKSQLLLSL